jgi:hypothetical protein
MQNMKWEKCVIYMTASRAHISEQQKVERKSFILWSCTSDVIKILNNCLEAIRKSPVKKKQSQEKKYPKKKIKNIHVIKKNRYISANESKQDAPSSTDSEKINLKPVSSPLLYTSSWHGA